MSQQVSAKVTGFLLVPGGPLWQLLCRVRLAADALIPLFLRDPRNS
jgi:hypothetical protein